MPTKRKITIPAATVKPVTKPVAVTKPVLGAAAKAQADAGRSNVEKPSKPVADTSKPKPVRGLTRAHSVLDKRRYPAETLSDADAPYLPFFAIFAKRGGGKFTIGETLNSRPDGVTLNNNPARLLRLAKLDYFTVTGTGDSRTATPTKLAFNSKAFAEAYRKAS